MALCYATAEHLDETLNEGMKCYIYQYITRDFYFGESLACCKLQHTRFILISVLNKS